MCAAGSGCLDVRVTRSDSDAALPWVKFGQFPAPGNTSNGQGSLRVAAQQGLAQPIIQSVTADFRAASASYLVNLGCVPMGATKIHAYLDDDLNADASDPQSSDYQDACPTPRSVVENVEDNVTSHVSLVLSRTCD